ncbi:MAG TPA: hypothetical protein VM681_05565 [Candidatus Thermoplasmatota archaeon]|nr:hypothetical protein [Candidatus Thermoplasmatota archaeon]
MKIGAVIFASLIAIMAMPMPVHAEESVEPAPVDLPPAAEPPEYPLFPEPMLDLVVVEVQTSSASSGGAVCTKKGQTTSGPQAANYNTGGSGSTTTTSCPGGSNGGRLSLVVFGAEEYRYGHWRDVSTWYRVSNDDDPKNRYYVTVTQFEGKGFSCGNPYHDITDVRHLARGWAAHGNTFLLDMDPRDEGTGQSTYSFMVGESTGIGYSWTQTKPAEFRYALYDGGSGGWDDQQYANRAGFGAWGGNTRFTGALQYAAAGAIPTGATGYAYVQMVHKSSCNGWSWHTDDTGWSFRKIDWA